MQNCMIPALLTCKNWEKKTCRLSFCDVKSDFSKKVYVSSRDLILHKNAIKVVYCTNKITF